MKRLIAKLSLLTVCLGLIIYSLFLISFETISAFAKNPHNFNKHQNLPTQNYSSDSNRISISNSNYQTQQQSVNLNVPAPQPVSAPPQQRIIYQTIYQTPPQPTPPPAQPVVYQQVIFQQAVTPSYPPPQQIQPTYVMQQPQVQRPAQIVYVTPSQYPAPTPQAVIYQPVAAATAAPVVKTPVYYQPVVQPVATATSSADVKELPKTGLPFAAWTLGGLIPAGWGLLKFKKGNKEILTTQDNPNHIWEKRQFTKI